MFVGWSLNTPELFFGLYTLGLWSWYWKSLLYSIIGSPSFTKNSMRKRISASLKYIIFSSVVVISKYIFKVQSNHFSVVLVQAHQNWSYQWLTSSYTSSRIHAFVLSILETLLARLEANHGSMSFKTDGMAHFSSLIFLCFTQHATIVWDRLLLYCLAHLYKEGFCGRIYWWLLLVGADLAPITRSVPPGGALCGGADGPWP